MCPCPGSRVNSIFERIASWVVAQIRMRASESERHLPSPTAVLKVLTTEAWPTQNLLAPLIARFAGPTWAQLGPTGPRWAHVGHTNLAIWDTSCITHWAQQWVNFEKERILHLTLVYRYYLVLRRHENMSLCTGSRVNSDYEQFASRVGAQFRTRPSEAQSDIAKRYQLNKIILFIHFFATYAIWYLL